MHILFFALFFIVCNISYPLFAAEEASTSEENKCFSDDEIKPLDETLRNKLGLDNVVIFSHVVGKNTPKGKGAEFLKQQIEERRDITSYTKLQVYPNALLFIDPIEGDPKVMNALKRNAVQLAAPSISKLIPCNSKLKIFDFPFLFNNIDEVETFYEQVKEKLFYKKDKNDDIFYLYKDKEGVMEYVVLGLWHGGMKQISLSEDFKQGNKPLYPFEIRVQSSKIIEDTFKYLGAITKNFAFKSVYGKLEKGIIKGQENTWSSIVEEKYYEVQKYFKETNHSYLGYLLVTNKTFWDSLTPEDKDKWSQMINGVSSEVKEAAISLNTQAKEKMEKYVTNETKEKKISILSCDEEDAKNSNVSCDKKDTKKQWCEQIYLEYFANWEKIITNDTELKELIKIAIRENYDINSKKIKDGCPFEQLEKLITK